MKTSECPRCSTPERAGHLWLVGTVHREGDSGEDVMTEYLQCYGQGQTSGGGCGYREDIVTRRKVPEEYRR